MYGHCRVSVYNTTSGTFLAGKQIFPIIAAVNATDEVAEVNQRLIDACHDDDCKTAVELAGDRSVDVNYIGTVSFRCRKTEVVLNGEEAHGVRVEYEEFKTDVTALFLAAHHGNFSIVKKLLSVGADVNQKLFRGYATTAAVREGHVEILEILLKAGASQPACEEALLEASRGGHARHAEVLMGSHMISPGVAVHALVTACCRGFVDVVDILIKCGVDANATDRVLLQSSKPYLHMNIDCNALVAAIVSRQSTVVELLLKAGIKTDFKVRLGSWSWDMTTGEEFKVGAGLAEPYNVAWCAVEYFESSGTILRLLLHHLSPNSPHLGRTLIYHAILCRNSTALSVLLSCGADVEFPVKTWSNTWTRPIHLAARLGSVEIIQCLLDFRCNRDAKTDKEETALMICVRNKHKECFKELAKAGADFGLVNVAGESASSTAGETRWTLGFQEAILDVIKTGIVIKSSNALVFSPVVFVTQTNNIEALKILVQQPGIDINERDKDGLSAAMVAASSGHVEAFRLLVNAGADVSLCTRYDNKHKDELEKIKVENSARGNVEEEVKLDERARKLVLGGERVKKHTRGGRGAPHWKTLRMVGSTGVLRWGRSEKRNVLCKEVKLGPSLEFFLLNQTKKGRGGRDEMGMFHVVTTGSREVHFVCEGGDEMAELWVRGIKLVTSEARKPSHVQFGQIIGIEV